MMNRLGVAAIALVLMFSFSLATSEPTFAGSKVGLGPIGYAMDVARTASQDAILLAKGEKKAKKAKKAKKVKKAKKSDEKKCAGLRKADKKKCLRAINKGADKGKKKGWFK